jgi:histidyl-tRNA synthetase
VTVWDPGFRAEALATAGELRGRGIPAEVYLGEERLGEQLGYASSRGIPLAVIRGAREQERGVVTVRDLRTREQVDVAPEGLVAHVAERLGRRPPSPNAG